MRRGSLVHRAMKRKLNLVDAYVVSGYFAALALPRGQFSPGDESLPRRYQDGLEADDPEDDLLFMIWYRKQPPSLGPANVTDDGVIEAPAVPPPAGIPALKAKETVAVFRTRSKLERDAWCWAINCEIEKIVREQREREERLRMSRCDLGCEGCRRARTTSCVVGTRKTVPDGVRPQTTLGSCSLSLPLESVSLAL